MSASETLAGGSFSQTGRLLAIDTPLGPDELLLTSLEGEDVLSRCFVYRVAIATQQADDAVQSLLGKPVTLWIGNENDADRRPVHGHVRRVISDGATIQDLGIYHLEVVPRLWFLSCTSDCRIFQGQSIPDILQAIFEGEGLIDFEFRLIRADYPPVDYCVQYQETAFDFVSRLMEHLGLFYWHEHSAGRHLLVIADRNAATAWCDPAEVTISSVSGTGEVQSLRFDCSFRPGRWTLNDYDFQSPTKLLKVDAPTTLNVPRMVNHEMYEFPGKFADQDAGRWLSRRRIELEEAQQHRVFGVGRAAGFDPGRRFKVSLARGRSETSYLVTEVRHHATDPIPEPGTGSPGYTNDFVAIPAETVFRPERLTPRPFARGVQTATVVGPAGENIWCDPFGRVKVQFHWDRRGQRNDNSSCWMRVAQPRAGSFYGHQVIPHVGHEVLVSFLEGDPDRPLITGTVPNALTMPPMVLPGEKHKTIQRDHGNNKIVMNGKPGQEHLSMVSPRGVNLFASGRTARPLSSGNTSTTMPFSVSPANNNNTQTVTTTSTPVTITNADGSVTNDATITSTSTVTSYSVPTTGTTGTYNIPVYMDATGLNQLWLNWYGTTQSDIDDGSNISSTQGTFGEQDGTVTDSYLNWGSEGRINCLVLGNNNLWVNKNSNTWIGGQANTHIEGQVAAQIDDNSTTTYGSPVSNNVAVQTTIWGSNNTIIGGANATSVAGDNVTSVVGGNETFVGGLNFSVNLGESLTINILASQTINLLSATSINVGFTNTFNFGPSNTYNDMKLDITATRVDNLATHMRQAGIILMTEGSSIKSCGMNLMACDTTILT